MPIYKTRLSSRSVPLAIAVLIATLFAVCVLGLEALAADAAPAHGRAWELVTPPDPNGVPAVVTLGIDATGDRLAYLTVGPAPGAAAGSIASSNVATRGAEGWTGKPVGYPYSVTETNFSLPFAVAASADLSTWIWSSPLALLPGAPTTPDRGVYRGTLDGGLALLGNGGIDPRLEVLGVSEDAQHVVFQTTSQLLPADAGRTDGKELYEYAGTTLRMVAVDDGGAPLSSCGSVGGSSNSPPNPVSRDASRIFFMSQVGDCASAPRRVYLRQDGTTTTEISASQCTRVDCNAPSEVRFMGATPDGATAFLATAQQLTDDDLDEGQDLYRYDVAGGTLSRVSVGSPGVAADVVPMRAYSSDDGDRVFFLATGTLVAGEGTQGEPNLYVADGDGLRFVATLQGADDWPAGAVWDAPLQEVAVTPEGEQLMFITARALTADDTDASRDVYLYGAEDDSLELVSGTTDSGNGAFDVQASLADDLLGLPPFPLNVPSALSDDGRHVFFTTDESLLPEDVNDKRDIYEWLDGEIGLVSSGTGTTGAMFLGASANAATVFVATDASLVSADDDGGDYDVYAARVGGGFADPPAPPPGCDGAACFPPPPGRIARRDPASLTHKSLGVHRPGAAALRRMARRGRLTLIVAAPGPGRISARVSARIGGRPRTVASGDATAVRAGKLSLRLRLSKSARRQLARGHLLALRVVLRHSQLERTTAIRFKLKGVK